VIGKANQPRSFKNVNLNSLPVIWRINKSVWMACEMLIEWLTIINKMIKQQNINILMVVDNCPAQPKVENLSNVTVEHIPPNTTSGLWLLDQGTGIKKI
jgi:hypothetical protein